MFLLKPFKFLLLTYHLLCKWNAVLIIPCVTFSYYGIFLLGSIVQLDFGFLTIINLICFIPLMLVLQFGPYDLSEIKFDKVLFKYHFFREKKYTIRSLAFDIYILPLFFWLFILNPLLEFLVYLKII